jgi:hypothetical protein
METKVCNKCNIEKDVTEFYSGRRKCKLCYGEYSKEYNQKNKEKRKKYLKENKEKIRKKEKEYRQKNKERLKKWNKEYYQKNKESIIKRSTEYREENKEKRKKYREENKKKINEQKREYYRKRKKYDTIFKIKERIKDIIRKSIKNNGYTKNSRSFEILGCSYEDFKEHIESHWEDWMYWDNYGIYNGKEKCGWDLDHIIPVGSAECEEDIYKLNHHSNIQPLCSYINRNVKRDIIDWES